eukprot:scaffold42566_cov60-Cyclotella_meneghiniana.AAC.1
MEYDPIAKSEKNNLILPETGVGLHDLALLELYTPKLSGQPIFDEVRIPNSQRDEVVTSNLAKELMETKGDATAYIAILMQYYNAEKKRKQSDEAKKLPLPKPDDTFVSQLSLDASAEKLVQFADEVDRAYLTAMSGSLGFNHVCEYLISPEVNTHFYNKLRNEFPYIHKALYSVVSTKYFKEPTDDEPIPSPLHDKQKQILYLFYGLIRARSLMLMRHWAIVEPLGYYYKGNQQPGSKSMGGMFSSSLPTSFDRLDEIYKADIEAFNNRLEFEPVLFGAFDNYQRMIQKKNQTAHKSAITHTGTAIFLKANVPIDLPQGSTVITPFGTRFKVTKCSRHESGKLFVTGEIYEATNETSQSEIALINGGALMPRIGWDVTWMPGFVPRPEITYHKQIVPPPRRAYLKDGVTDADVVLGHDRMFREPLQSDAVSLTSERMHSMQCLSNRIVDFSTYANYLQPTDEQDLSPLQKRFKASVDCVQKEIDAARKFQRDLVHHVNPNAGQVDKMFAFPLSPHCETSHEGMLMVYADMGKSFRLFDIEESNTGGVVGRCSLTPTSRKRKINLCVDALSSKMWRSLELNLTKKLTEIGSSQYVESLLNALSSFTCQHDYFHENRMHRQDVIWRQFYGCVLQAFQAETRTLRINGDPVKNNVQTHEAFLEVCYRALKRHRINRFLAKAGEDCFSRLDGESEKDMILRWDQTFVEY